MEYFEDKKNRLGVFAIISDLDRNPSEIYEQYKSREDIEQVFDTMKCDHESDKIYLRDSGKVKGFFFKDPEGAEGSQLTEKDVSK